MTTRAMRLAGWASLTALVVSTAPAGAAPQQPVAGVEAAWLNLPTRPSFDFSTNQIPSRDHVMQTLNYVADAQIADMAKRPIPLSTGGALQEIAPNWVAAAFYTGVARLARTSDDPRILRFLTMVAEHYNYALRGGKSDKTLLNADDMAVGDLYEELYARRRAQGILMPLEQRLDFASHYLARPDDDDGPLIWWWCDALYMAPPVLARMSQLTGNPQYIAAMDKEWRRTAARLWDPGQLLFYRDARFKGRHGADGKPIFWSRGNGWVLGGLARVLSAMPEDFAGRDFYTGLYTKLAGRILELQQPDGLWRADLLHPDAYPEAETSGSALLLYGLAWGVNHGLLPRDKTLPALTRGWAGLNRHILPNGLVGAAQKTGDQPVHTAPTDTGPYATGAYLLAGLEMADLGKPVQPLPVPEPARDSDAVIAATTPAPPPPATIKGAEEKKRRAAEMKAVAALAYDPATRGRPDAVEPLTPPTGVARKPQAIAHYAPERYDDILWENDRVALRIYGPALQKQEPPSGSGIDIWGKRVRWPFMQRQLKFPNYHIDRGEGLDFYDVGQSRGAGGLGIWYDNKLWVSRNWAKKQVAQGAGDAAQFAVDYNPWPVDVVRRVWEHRTFNLPLGSNFTRMQSTLGSDTKDPLVVGIGIAKHATGPGQAIVSQDAAHGLLTVTGPDNPDHGQMFVTVAVDPSMVTGFAQDALNYLILVKVMPGKPFVYYSGYAYDRGLDIHTTADWSKLVAATNFDFTPVAD
ncbi:MAG: glycoside hydrolase family 88 protein [Sphingomonas sp.]